MPPYCVQTDAFNKCLACSNGYSLDGLNCKSQTCPSNYYLKNGTCTAVTPFCNSFDPYQGTCFSCSNGFYLDQYGLCQSNPTGGIILLPNGCYDRFYLQGNKCVKVNPECGNYDYNNGRCLTCLDKNFIAN
jgi:hypothetical protein